MMVSRRIFFVLLVFFLIGSVLVSADMSSSSNYNMSTIVLDSGGTATSSSNFFSKLVLGIISGATQSGSFKNFLGLFYGLDTTSANVNIVYPTATTYYSFVGDLRYTVDATGSYCWFSKGSANSSAVSAGTNWTNVYSGSVNGQNDWIVYCNDSANNVGSGEVSFNIDDEIPNVYFSGSTPANGDVLSNSYFTINATSADESGEHSTFLDFNNSLVGWWKMEETSDGITFIDSSQYGNDGVCSGSTCPNVTGGKRGLAYNFDKVNDQILISNSESLNISEELTISSWFYLDSTSTAYQHIISKGESGGTINMQYMIAVLSNNYVRFYIGNTTSGSSLTSSSPINIGRWYNIIVILNSTNQYMYIDGILNNSVTRAIAPYYNTKKIAIGSNGVGSELINGSIDDVMIFNRALSASEVKSIYNAQSNQYGNYFTDIGNGFYNYTIYSEDLAGNVNLTYRNLTVNMVPSGLNVSILDDKELNSELGDLNLTWIDSSNGEDGFSVERSSDNSSFVEINTTEGDVVTYKDDNLLDNSIFFYRLRSFVGEAYSSYSNVAYNITTDKTAPFNPFFNLIENKSANGINAEIDDSDNGLVLYMPFEEKQGTIAYDWSGEENHGTVNGATYVNGSDGNGGALSFDGFGSSASVDDFNANFNNFTFSFWAKFNQYSYMTIMDDGGVQFKWRISTDLPYWNFYDSDGVYRGGLHYTERPELDKWYYYTFTYDGRFKRIYLNGKLDNSYDLGNYVVKNNGYMNITIPNEETTYGLIDEVRIYNRSLSQKEIINDMQSGLIKHKLYMSEDSSGTYLDVNSPIVNGDAEMGDTTNFGFDGITTDAYEGNYAFYETGYKWLYDSDLIPVDNISKYTVSGMFKSNGTGGMSKLYFGFVGYNDKKQRIYAINVNAVANTQTELYEDIKSTDKVVKIKNCTNWYVLYHGLIAFDIDDSGSYADLPNYNTGNGNITRVQNMGDYCEIEFGTTVGKTYPAGTKIRMHTSGGDIYTASSGSLIPTSWTEKNGTISGEALFGTNYNKFWRGTKYIKFSMGINYGQGSTYTALIDNLKLTVQNGSVSNSYYLTPAGIDRASPSNITSLVSADVEEEGFYTISQANFSWDASTDSGSDYFYYINTEDKNGNKGSLITNSYFTNYNVSKNLVSRWSNWTLNAGQWEVGENNKPRIYHGIGGSDTYMISNNIILETNKTYYVILNVTINSGILAWQNSYPTFTSSGVYKFYYIYNTTLGGGKILLDDQSSNLAKDITINSVEVFAVENQTITSDVAGYSVLCDDWQNSIPNNLVDTTQTNYQCSLTEGENYFFVKAIDGAGNSGNITRFGPFYVDTGAPKIQFVSPTPANSTESSNTNVELNVEIQDYSLNSLNFSWNDLKYNSLSEGLVLMMNFENSSIFKENDTFVKDLSGHGNDGKIIGGATYTTGKYGNGVNFSGSYQYILVNDSSSLDISGDMTVSAWVKLSESGTYGIIHKGNNTNNGAGLAYGWSDGGFEFISWNSQNVPAVSPSASDIGSWHYLVGVVSSGIRYLYVDGIYAGGSSIGVNSWANTNNLTIGIGNNGAAGSYKGVIDEVRVYNRSMSADEVKMLYFSNLKKTSDVDWSLYLNITNISKDKYWYNASACDRAGNCNSTSTYVWSRINVAPIISYLKINTTNGKARATQNISVSNITSYDIDTEDTVYNITDWRVNGTSLAVLNMPFNTNSSTTTKDYSTNANSGTINGATWTSSGKVGGAYNFDGVNDYILANKIGTLKTFSVWVNTQTLENSIIFTNYETKSGLGFYGGSYRYLILKSGNTSYSNRMAVLPSEFSTNQWNNIVVTYADDGTPSCYVNGVETSYAGSNYWIEVDNPYIIIGKRYNITPSYFFNGSIDDVMIFNRSLSAEQIKMIYLDGMAGHSLLNISSEEVWDKESWSVMVTPNDLQTDGVSLLSNIINMTNHLPTVSLASPTNGAEITNRTPEFNWTGYDADGDSLTYELQIEEIKLTGTAICDNDISRSNLNINRWTPTEELKCLGDYGYYYRWRVRAYDGEDYGTWTAYNNFTLNAYVVISLVNSEVNFGTLDYLEEDNTSDGDPQPFVLKNDGNVKINISANATPMWTTKTTESEYYQTKVDNRSGFEGAFEWLTSITNWINMSLTGGVVMVDRLDYHDTNDTVEVDVKLRVPESEGPGLKNSTVVFEAKFAEAEV